MKEKSLQVINHYGVLEQLKYFQSEVFELNESIITGELKDLDNKAVNHIAEEIADVTFMLKQFKHYYDISDEQVEEIMNFKADRQLKRIEAGE